MRAPLWESLEMVEEMDYVWFDDLVECFASGRGMWILQQQDEFADKFTASAASLEHVEFQGCAQVGLKFQFWVAMEAQQESWDSDGDLAWKSENRQQEDSKQSLIRVQKLSTRIFGTS